MLAVRELNPALKLVVCEETAPEKLSEAESSAMYIVPGGLLLSVHVAVKLVAPRPEMAAASGTAAGVTVEPSVV